jgi:hypothetical protein
MDYGPRTTDHGPWTTDHGPRTMDHGRWTMDHGPRTTDLGRTKHQGPRTKDRYFPRMKDCDEAGSLSIFS